MGSWTNWAAPATAAFIIMGRGVEGAASETLWTSPATSCSCALRKAVPLLLMTVTQPFKSAAFWSEPMVST